MIKKDPTERHADTVIREERRRFLMVADAHKKIRLGNSLRKEVFIPLRDRLESLGLNSFEIQRSPEDNVAISGYEKLQGALITRWVKQYPRLAEFEWIYEAINLELDIWFAFCRQAPAKAPFGSKPGYARPQVRPRPADPFLGGDDVESYSRQIRDYAETVIAEEEEYTRTIQRARAKLLRDRGSQSVH